MVAFGRRRGGGEVERCGIDPADRVIVEENEVGGKKETFIDFSRAARARD